MGRHQSIRRHAGGALDIDHYRRRARRLRRLAQRRAWAAFRRAVAALASRLLAGATARR